MNKLWQQLPDDMVGVIMSYGDPLITDLYKNVMGQLLYHMNEFNIHRNNKQRPFNRWFLLPETDYYKYVLRECFLKKHINKYYGTLSNTYGSSSSNYLSIMNNNDVIITIMNNNHIINVNINNYIDNIIDNYDNI